MGLLRKSHIDLFSGIGGFALASKWAGFETIQFVENDKYCCKVLKKNFPEIPIHDDIKTFKATDFRGCGLITGGFPCQPVSQAGQRRGSEDDRWLWPQMYRVILESRPTYVLIENVAGLITLGLDDVLVDLEKADYSFQTFNIPAVAVDARHRRQRIWILAYTECDTEGSSYRSKSGIGSGRRQKQNISKWDEMGSDTANGSEDVAYSSKQRLQGTEWQKHEGGRERFTECSKDVAHSNSKRQQRQGKFKSTICAEEAGKRETTRVVDGSGPIIWPTEPDVGRVAHGVRRRVDRLRGLGNSICPQVAYEIIRCLK